MDGNESSYKLLDVAVTALVGVISGIAGYWARGRIDFSNKKKDVSFEGRRKAADTIHPIIVEYVRLSEKLCGENAPSTGLTLDACIHAYKENVRELVRLRDKLNNTTAQFMHYFDIGTAEKAEKMNSLLLTQLGALARTFEAAEADYMGDGDEVLRIMKCGISDYCDKFTREISPVMDAVKEGTNS